MFHKGMFFLFYLILVNQVIAQKKNDTIVIKHFDKDDQEVIYKNFKKYKRSDDLIEYTTVWEKVNDTTFFFDLYDKYGRIKKITEFRDSLLTIKNGIVGEYDGDHLMGIGNYLDNKKDAFWITFNKNTKPSQFLTFHNDVKSEVVIDSAFNTNFFWQSFMSDYNEDARWEIFENTYPLEIQKSITDIKSKIRGTLRRFDVIQTPFHLLCYVNSSGILKYIAVLKFMPYNKMEIFDNRTLGNNGFQNRNPKIIKTKYQFAYEIGRAIKKSKEVKLPIELQNEFYNKFLTIHFLFNTQKDGKRINTIF